MKRFSVFAFCILLMTGIYSESSIGLVTDLRTDNSAFVVDEGEKITDAEATAFITDMYNNKRYENDDFLRSHCTPKLLKKMAADFGYDCPQGICYAVWEFRSGAQDYATERLHRIISITSLGDGFYKYFFFDRGIRGANKLRLTKQNGEILMDDVEAIPQGANSAIRSRVLTPSDLLQVDAMPKDSLDNFLYYHGYQCINEPYQGKIPRAGRWIAM